MNRSRITLAGLGLAALLVAAAPYRSAAQSPADDRDAVLVAPLAPEDPAAQLRPEQLNVPMLTVAPPARGVRPLPPGVGSYEIEHDVTTGRTTVSGAPSELLHQPTAGEPLLSPGSPGANPLRSEEPRRPPQTGPGPKRVFGTDDRTMITDTTVFPWRAQCKLFMRFPDGQNFVGSATVISRRYVITAGHCVYDSNHGGWATQIEVVAGLNGTYKPYGSAWATYFRSFSGWTQYRSFDDDMGLITLDRNLGDSTGWLGYAAPSSVNGTTGNISNYPVDRDKGVRQYYSYGPINSSTANQMMYTIDMYPGASGSGMYYKTNAGDRYVFGVNSWERSDTNGACRMNVGKFNSIQSFIASGK